MQGTRLVDVEGSQACTRPLDAALSRSAVQRHVTGAKMRKNAEILGAPAIRSGGDDQPSSAALDLLGKPALQFGGRGFVGLRGDHANGLRLGRDRVQRLLAFTDADLVDDQAFSLALEE